MVVKSLLALAILVCPSFAQNARSQEGSFQDKILQRAFGENCEELSRSIRFYFGSKGLAWATEKFTIEPDGRVKLSPFSMVRFDKSGEKGSPIITLRSEWALLTLDRPVASLTDLVNRKLISAELPGEVRLAFK